MRLRWLIIIPLLMPLVSCQENKNEFTITWKNVDGTVLEVDQNIPKGAMPTYNKGEPTYGPIREKGSSKGTSYYFSGWDSELTEVKQDKTYTATYTTRPNYDVKWVNPNGDILERLQYVVEGYKPTYSKDLPKKEHEGDKYFAFTGWDEEQHTITSDTTYTAQYDETTETRDYDADGLVDYLDPNYKSIDNNVSYQYESSDKGKFNFAIDYVDYFIKNNDQVYSPRVAKFLAGLNIDLHRKGHVSFPMEPSDFNDKTFIYKHLGCEDIEDFYLNGSSYNYDRNDTGGAILAHHKVVKNTIVTHEVNEDYNIFFVSIKPSTLNDTDYWKSNLDIGSKDPSYEQLTGIHPEWDNKDYHKGIYITAKRIKEKVDDYLAKFSDLTNKILVITGHSRGGAIANYIAKQYLGNNDYLKMFAYTFATPAYYYGDTNEGDPIFNLLNDDDLVMYLPHDDFNGKRFGQDYHVSVNDSYYSEYSNFTSHRYNKADNIPDFIEEDLKPVVPNRDILYKIDESEERCKGYKHIFITSTLAKKNYEDKLELLRKYNISGSSDSPYHLYYDDNKTITGYNCPYALFKIAMEMLDMPDISLADALELLDIFDNYRGIFNALTDKLGIDLDNPLAKIAYPHHMTSYYVMADNYSPS